MNVLISKLISFRAFTRCLLSELSSRFNGEEFSGYDLALNFRNLEGEQSLKHSSRSPLSVLESIIDNGYLFAVPKNRRTIERRMIRRNGFGKILIPMKNLVACEACGHFHPVHTVCGNCYEKVKKETEVMQAEVFNQLKLDPIDRDIVVLYENDSKDNEVVQGKRIVELPKARPAWFTKNLLEKDSETAREPAKSISEHKEQPFFTKD